jgi:hypothetical protein
MTFIKRFPRTLCIILFCVSPATLFAGCGGDAQKHEAQGLEKLSIVSSTAPLSNRIVERAEVNAASDVNGVRTFLQLWSLLQYRAWDQAVAMFQPALREVIGPELLTGALASEVIVWQATKPQIVSATQSSGTVLIKFLARDEKDNLLPASISLQRGAAGSWQVSFFSLLDGALQHTVEHREQAALAPLSTKPAAEAVRQGETAGSLQSLYLERQVRKRGAVP